MSAVFAEEPAASQTKERLVVMGGPITEIVFALGGEKDIVGVDKTSLYPARAQKFPQVGVVRAISPEGVLSMNPTKIISSSSLGPPAAASQLKASGIPLVLVDNPKSEKSLMEAIATLGKEINREKEAEELIKKLTDELAVVNELASKQTSPRVIFLMGMAGSLSAAGEETQAGGILSMAGGKNIFSGFRGYKPVSEEAILEAKPDFILVANHTSQGDVSAPDDPKKLLQKFGFKSVNALEKTKIVPIDMGEFLIIGPRTGETALKLAKIFSKPADTAGN
jgi:iron complex transport system substrate-binding protein